MRGVRAAVPERPDPRRRRRLARRDRRDRRRARRAATRRVEVLHRPGQAGLGPAYLAGFAHALRGGAGYVLEMDADFSHDPRRPAAAARARGGRRRPRARLALRRRRRRRGLGPAAARDLARRLPLRAARPRRRRARPHRRLQVLPRARCSSDRPETVRSEGYAFQVELTYRALRAAFASSRCRSPSASARRRLEDVGADRPGGDLAGARAAARPPPRRAPAGPRLRRTRDPADPRGMKTEQLAVVQGWADTRERCGAGTRGPWSVLRPVGARQRGSSPCCCSPRPGLVATLTTPDPTGAAFPGVPPPRDARRLRLRPVPQPARARAARARLRRRVHRRLVAAAVAEGYSGVWRWIHDLAGPLAIALRRRRHALLARHAGLRARRHASTLAAELGISPLVLVLGSCRTRCPSCSRSSSRSPRGRSRAAPALGRAARRDLRHDRDRGPVLLLAAAVEVWVTPHLLLALS